MKGYKMNKKQDENELRVCVACKAMDGSQVVIDVETEEIIGKKIGSFEKID